MTLLRFPRARSNSSRQPAAQVFAPRRTLLALEPRTLYDGAAAVVADKVADSQHHTAQADHDGQAGQAQARSIAEPGRDAQPHEQAQTNELLFVDTSVSGWQNIVAQAKPNVQVVLLDPARDPIDQIAQTMSQEGKVDAIHIVSHGADGSLQIGGRSIDLTALQGYSTQLATIGEHLTADGDILLYGCDIGEGAAGAQFVQALARATGADVAASTDATGAAALGGDWVLEYQFGPIESTALRADAFADLLQAPSVTGSMKDSSVVEPSSLNDAGASDLALGGWVIAGDGVGTDQVTVQVTLSNPGAGTLSDAGGTGTALGGDTGFSFTGTAAQATAWVNQLRFSAADTELGNTAATTQLTVSVTDVDSPGVSSAKAIKLTVTPSNDPTQFTANPGDGQQSVNEIGSTTITGRAGSDTGAAALHIYDPEVIKGTQNASQIVYRLTDAPDYGYLTLNGVRLGVGSIFTQADVLGNKLAYVHTASGANQNTADAFTVSVNDGATPQADSATKTVTLNVTPVNQAPVIAGSGGSVFEGQPRNAQDGGTPATPLSVVGDFIDANGGGDPGDAVLQVTITALTAHGTLHYTGQATIGGTTQTIDRDLTQADIDSGFVIDYTARSGLTYANDGIDVAGLPPNDSFGIRVTDGGGGAGASAVKSVDGTVNITVRPVDDDPTFVNASTREATVDANGADHAAGTADDYRVTLTPDMLQAQDVDSTDAQLTFVVTQVPGSGLLLLNDGVLEAGATFTMADVRAGRVQYLQTAVRTDASPTDTFLFQVQDNALALHWNADGTSYTRPGGVYDAAGADAALTTFAFNVNLVQSETPDYTGPANPDHSSTPAPSTTVTTEHAGDDPNPGGVPIGTLIEGGSITLWGDDGTHPIMLNYTADGIPPTQVVYTVEGFANGWSGQLLKNGVAMSVYSTFTQDDLNNGRITYQHDGSEHFESTVTLRVAAGGAQSDAALSTNDINFTFYITPVNDAPDAHGSSDTVIAEGGTVAVTTGMLSFSDPDDANSGSTYEDGTFDGTLPANGADLNFAINNGAGGSNPLQFGIDALPQHGTLEYWTGSAWKAITSADLNSLLLDASLLTSSAGTTGLRYVHDSSETRSDSFSVYAVDNRGVHSADGTVGITITAVNDGPQIAKDPTQADPSGTSPNVIGPDGDPGKQADNEPLTVVEEGGFKQITSDMLLAYDPDSTSEQVQYRITAAPASGHLAYSTDGINFTTIGVGASFSQKDVNEGHIYYVNDGTEPASAGYPSSPDDSFTFTVADGDKEQAGNQFWIYVKPTNDAPTVTAPSGPVVIDSTSPANNPVAGFSIHDVDLDNVLAGVETDFVQVTVRLLDKDGNAFSLGQYSDVTIGYGSGSGATVDGTHGGNHDFLTLRGTQAQVNAALAGLAVTFANDHDAVYQVQVIADDRVRDASGNLIDTDSGTAGVQPEANGGPLNQASPGPGEPTAVPATEHDWYTETVAANDPNIGAKAVAVWASSVNDVPTVTLPAAPTDIYEDTPYEFSAAKSNAVSIADSESSAFGQAVQVTLKVSDGTLTFSASESGVTVSGSGTGTVVLTGSADRIQALLDDGFTYKGNADFNDVDTLTVTVNEYQAAVGGDVGSGSVANADVVKSVTLDLVAVNDAPTVTAPAGPIDVGTNTVVAISGVSVGDSHDLGSGSDLQPGEHDFVQVTVRLLDGSGNPVTDYTGIVLQLGATAGASPVAGVDLGDGSGHYDGQGTPLVLRGTLENVNAALAQLKLSVTGDRNVTYQLQVLADDRMRDQATGALLDADSGTAGTQAYANGGAVNQQANLPSVPNGDALFSDPVNTTTATATSLYDIVASTVVLHVSSTNDAPTIGLPPSLTLSEDAAASSVKSGSTYITIGDTDDFGSNLTVVLTPHNGKLSFTSTSGVSVSGDGTAGYTLTGTKDAINTVLQNLQFTPTANVNGPSGIASIDVSVTDTALPGSSGGDKTTAQTLEIAVTAVNDRPSINTNVTLPAYTEDVTNPAGTTISSLASSFGYSDNKDDQSGVSNGAVSGYDNSTPMSYIAITGSTTVAGQGSWQVSDGAGGWITIPTSGLSTSKALIFSSDRAIRFVSSANFFGTPGTLTIYAADGSQVLTSSASATDTRSLVTGATSPWSQTSRFLQTTVTNVNDRPTGTDASMPSQNEDTNGGATVSSLDFGYSDSTDKQTGIPGGGNQATAMGGIAIVGNTADAATQGTWQFNTGLGWIDVGAVSDSSARVISTDAQLRFVPVANYNGTPPGLDVRLSDAAVGYQASADISAAAADATGQWSTVVHLNGSVVKQNDAPVLGGSAANPTAPENSTTESGLSVDGVHLFNNDASLSDLDLGTTAGLAGTVFGAGAVHVQITGGYASGDVLYVDPTVLSGLSGVTVSAGTDGTLTISLAQGTTLTDVQNLIAAIYYKSTSDNPTANNTNATRDYKVWVSDGENAQAGGDAGGPASLDSAAITGTLTITPLNDAPVVDLNGATTGQDSTYTWVEPSNATPLPKAFMPDATLGDVDNANLTQMQMVVGGAVDTGYEDLVVGGVTFDLSADKTASAGGFDISYTASTHTFTITPTAGIATVGSFQSLLQGMQYNNRTDNPTAGDRTVTVKVTDAGLDDAATDGVGDNQLDSNAATATITVQPSNDQPVITGLDPVSYHENDINAAPAVIDANIVLTDIDSPNFNGGTLSVTGLKAGDQVGILSDGTATLGAVKLDGSTVQYYDGSAWVDVGTYTSTAGDGGSLSISLNANVTTAVAQSLVEHLTFANSSDDPIQARTLSISVNDGGSGTTQVATVAVSIIRDNDAPSITDLDATSPNATAADKYLQGGSPVVIDPNVSLVDPELGTANRDNWSGATLTISRHGGASADDLFGASGSLHLTGGNVVVGSTIIGTFTEAGGTLEITFTSAATTDLVNQAARSITYGNAVTTPGALGYGSVTLDWVLNDQNINTTGGGTAGGGQDQGTGGRLLDTQSIVLNINRLPVATNNAYTVHEDDGSAVVGNALTDATADSDQDSDTLSAVVQTGVAGSSGGLFSIGADGKVTFDTNGDFESLAEGVQKQTTFTYQVSDGHGGYNSATVTVTVIGVNDAPVAVNDVNSTDEDTSITVSDKANGVLPNDTDVDTPNTDLAVSEVNGSAANIGTAVAGSNGGTFTLKTDGTYTFDPGKDFQYLKNGDTPATTSITYTVSDGKGGTDTATLTITVTGSDDTLGIAITDTDGAASSGQNSVVEKTGDTVTGTATITSTAGVKTVTVGGVDISGATATPVTIPATANGTLVITGYDAATGVINYKYTEADTAHDHNAANDNIVDNFEIKVTDYADQVKSSDLTIYVLDTVPTANADGNSVTEDASTPITGNVIDGTNSTLTGSADTLGADGATVTGAQFGALTGGATHVADGGVNAVGSDTTALAGDYGTLIVHADGSYSYALDNSNLAVQHLVAGDTLTETYTYTLTDGDGDQSTTTLTITINGANDGVTVTVPDNHPTTPVTGDKTDQVVFERGLSNGSAPDADDLSVVSSFTVKALDGVDGTQAVTLGYTDGTGAQTLTLSKTDLEGLSTTAKTITTQYGTLVLNGYSQAADGTITVNYTYTLTTAPSVDSTDTTDSFLIQAKDRDGDVGAGTDASRTLNIKIVDDAPTTVADVNSVTEDAGTPITGNVVSGTGSPLAGTDTLGADGATVTGAQFGALTGGATHVADGGVNAGGADTTALAGDYGTLIVHADGSYSYTLDNANTTVNALKDGETLTQTYTYTLTDGDGDQSTTTLTITINGHTDGAPTITPDDGNGTADGHVTVREAGLADHDDSQTNTGTIAVDVPDGLVSIDVGGTTVSAADLHSLDPADPATFITITTPQGEITLTGFDVTATVGGVPTEGTLTYSYTLTQVQNTPGDDSNTESIALGITDAGHGTSSSTLTINIVDDTPTADNDTNSVTEDSGIAATGNVFANDRIGADGASTPGPVTDVAHGATSGTVGSALDGAYGKLTLNADGSYSYVLDDTNPAVNRLAAGETLTETVSYTITDGDGDTSTATLTLTVRGANDAPVTVGKLPDVGQNDSTVVKVPTAGGFTDVDASNTLTYTATGLPPGLSIDKSTGEITGTLTHDASQGGDHGLYHIVVTATDDAGAPVSQTFTFQVLNPPPEAHPDTGAVDADSTLSVGGTQGTIHGAPGRDTDVDGDPLTVIGVRTGTAGDVASVGTGNVGTALVGQYGTLTLNADGSYTYVADQPAAKTLKAHTTASDVFSYAISDGNGGVSYTTLNISVTGIVRALPQPPAPPDFRPIIDASQRPFSRSDSLITDPPHIWEDAYHENRVTNLSMPMHPIVYVEVTVQAEQNRRDYDDARADGVDLDLVLPIEARLSSWTRGLGDDQTIYVKHAVDRAERERLILQGLALGRDGRTSLSADNLLSNHGIFASNRALQWLAHPDHDRDARHSGEQGAGGRDGHEPGQANGQGQGEGQTQGQTQTQGRSDTGRSRGASAFSEQLRRMSRDVSTGTGSEHSRQPAHPFVRVAQSNPSIITE